MTSWDAVAGDVGTGSSETDFAMASSISLGGSFLALASLELSLRFEGVERSRFSFEGARLLWRAVPELVGLDLPLGVGL